MALPETIETDPEIHLQRVIAEFGRHYPDASPATIQRAYEVAAAAHADPRFELAGLWSHLHSPEDPPTSDGQLLRFDIATTALREARVPVPPRHAGVSVSISAASGYSHSRRLRPLPPPFR